MLNLRHAIKELSVKNTFFQKLYFITLLNENSQVILGNYISKHVYFKNYQDGALYVECDDYVWATELKKMTRQIKKRILEKLQIKIENIFIEVKQSFRPKIEK
ncbi:MAG: DUF721 domain-containing protein [Fervidobacterium sp.]|nr:DUF721 domain-containing protein [Fervidobacterium sp.]